MHMVLLKGGKMIVNKLAVKGNSVFILVPEIIDNSHTKMIIRMALLKPDIVWEYKGWQIAKYLSILNATIINTDE